MRKHVAFLGIISGLAVALLFNNCSPQHVNDSQADGFSLAQEITFTACAFKDDMDLFTKTYQPFLTQHCSSCHVQGGQGKGAFASSGALVSYNAFNVVGYEMIGDFATNDAHKPPYTGAQNGSAIALLENQWIAGLENIASCAGNGGISLPVIDESQRLETFSKGINAPETGAPVTLTWTLPNDINDKNGTVTVPAVGGSVLSISVRKTTVGGKPMYEINQPTLRAIGTDILIQSIIVKLNGVAVPGQTTFRYIDEGVRMSDPTGTMLSPGAMLVSGVITPYDILSLSIGTLQPVVLPPRPVLPVASFSQTALSTSETISVPAGKPTSSNQNYLDIKVFLDKPYLEGYVTATIGVVTTGPAVGRATNRATTVETNLAFDDRDLIIDRWDWDYSTESSAVVFDAGVTVATIRIKVANDQRDEPDETIKLTIRSIVNATKNPALSDLTITIADDDAAPNPVIPTFSQLMRQGPSEGSGGVLFDYCLRCHNTVDNRGGYNLTDYDLMINNGVLVPGDNQSMMFRRMNEDIPGLRTMPLDGLLPSAKRREVEMWILNGAKND